MAPATVAVVRLRVFPEQSGLLLFTTGVPGTGLTVIVIEFDVAGLFVTPAKFEVKTQETTSPLARVVVVKDAPVATFIPFTFHW